jgi:HD superfamily phosphohydrolase
VKYGVFDLHRLVNTVCKAARFSRIAFEESAVPALEQMILARYFMHDQVYSHKTRIRADAMAIRAAILAEQCGAIDGSNLRFDGIVKDLDNFLSLDDESLLHSILQGDCEDSKFLVEGLRNRRLLQSVVRLPLDQEHIPNEDVRIEIPNFSKSRSVLTDIETEFARELHFSPDLTIVNIQSFQSPTIPSPNGAIHIGDVLIRKEETGEIRSMNEFVRVLRNDQDEERRRKEILYVHAPVENWQDEDQREKIKKKSKDAILGILEEKALNLSLSETS